MEVGSFEGIDAMLAVPTVWDFQSHNREHVMRLVPEPIGYDNINGFEGTDLFQREGFGIALANLVTLTDGPLVVSLEAPWGEGKTTFIHQWRHHVEKKKGVRCIYFDAFRSDFHSDAFMTLATELYRFAAEVLPDDHSDVEEFKEGAIKLFKILSKSVVKTALQLVPMGELANETASTLVGEVKNQLSEAVDGLYDEAFAEQAKLDDVLVQFQDVLSAVVENIYEKGDHQEEASEKPLVFIIDELDRCRPDFALQLLEKIKHVFSVPKVAFVLVNNPEQLQESVRATYGNGIDANRYLHKFYTLSMMLPINKKYSYDQPSDIEKYVKHLFNGLGETVPNRHEYMEAVSAICTHKKQGLREVERIVGYVIAYQLMKPESGRKVENIAMIQSFVCCVKVLDPELFMKMLNGLATLEDVQKFFNTSNLPGDASIIDFLYGLISWLYTDQPDDLTASEREVYDSYDRSMWSQLTSMNRDRSIFRSRVITPLGYLQ